MDKKQKQMYVQVVNLETGKVFSLPTLYTDRVEACVCGQNYVRDRQAEDRFSPLFFRVMISYDGKVAEPFIFHDEDEDEEEMPTCGDCDGDCQFCPTNYDVEDEDTEEPDWQDYCKDEEFLNYFINLMKKA
jgi:hypothetical protein